MSLIRCIVLQFSFYVIENVLISDEQKYAYFCVIYQCFTIDVYL